MAKIKYDVRDVEPSRSFDKPIPVGIYRMAIVNCVKRQSNSGNDMLEIEMEVLKGEHKGRKVWEYIVLDESSEWKQRQLIDALGMKLSGTLDTDKLIGKTITIKTKHDSFERPNDETGEMEVVVTSKVASLLKLKKAGADADEEEEPEAEEEAEEAEPEAEEEPEEEAAEPEAESDDEEEYTWDDLQGMDRKELKAFIKENESDHVVKKGETEDAIREALAEEFGIEQGEAEEEEPEAEEEAEAEEEESGYDDWAMPDLKKELKSRDLKVAGTKKVLVKRLEADDKKGKSSKKKDEPF